MTQPTFTIEVGTTPGYDPAAWEDVSDRFIVGGSVEYGRQSELAEIETGTSALALDNWDGHWDPGIDPNTAVRMSATVGATTYPLAYGVVEAGPAEWPVFGLDAVVNVDLADGMTLLAREERDDVWLIGARTGFRIGALLDLADWPAEMRDIDEGVVLLDEFEAGPLNVMAAIREAVEAEQGLCYIGPDGVFYFRDRHARLDATPTVTFGGVGILLDHAGEPLLDHLGHWIGDGTYSGVDYEDLLPRYDDATLWTVGRVEMADGRVFEHIDESAAAVYGRRVYPIRDLPISTPQAQAQAAWHVVRYANPRRRFEQLTVLADDPDTFAAVLALRPGDLVNLKAYPPSGTSPVDELVHVEACRHQFGPNRWQSTFRLSPYFGAGPWLVLDDEEAGVLDGTRKVSP